MALIQCPECGKEISDTAEKCPHCGAGKKSSGAKKGCAVILGLMVVLAIVLFVWAGGGSDSTSAPVAKTDPAKMAPDVSIATSDEEIEITNRSTRPWPEMEIYINDVPDGFKLKAAAPAAGSKVRVQFSRFVDKKGVRYNPATHGMVKIWIGGSGRDFRQFNVR